MFDLLSLLTTYLHSNFTLPQVIINKISLYIYKLSHVAEGVFIYMPVFIGLLQGPKKQNLHQYREEVDWTPNPGK